MGKYDIINSVEDLIKSVEFLSDTSDLHILFRGQKNSKPLLPRIARKNPSTNTKKLEEKLLSEFKRRLANKADISTMDDWDLLSYAQHYGLSTRLLDWTTNPLVALWFACADNYSNTSSYIYLLLANDEMLLDKGIEKCPLDIKKSYVVKPNINNIRVQSQSGWFTVHRYSQQSKCFVDLHKNNNMSTVLMKEIPHNNQKNIMKTLDKLGVNYESIFPGAEGTAKYLNWFHRI